MSVEENKAIVRRYFERGLNKSDMDIVRDSLAPDYVGYWASGEAVGRADGERIIESVNKAFPDFKYTIETIVGDGEFVSTRVSVSATHKGEFFGMKPTGKTYKWGEAVFSRLQDGKIVEEWQYITSPGLAEQMRQSQVN